MESQLNIGGQIEMDPTVRRFSLAKVKLHVKARHLRYNYCTYTNCYSMADYCVAIVV